MSESSEANGSGPSYPTSFGRGWIPADRDIGLPGEELTTGSEGAAPPPLQGRGSGGGGSPHEPSLVGKSPHPNPSPEGEGLRMINHNSWTPARKAAFLHHLAEAGNVRAAAARVGLSHQSAYVARRRDRAFDAGWQAALVLARGAAEEALSTRALDGYEEPVWFRGERVGTRRRHDSRLLLAHLARLDKAAEETIAGDLAARFDELVAVVAGEAPGGELVDLGHSWDTPAPLLPVAREPWADARAPHLQNEARAQWQADKRAGLATAADEPTVLNTPWFDAALAEWDAWHARLRRRRHRGGGRKPRAAARQLGERRRVRRLWLRGRTRRGWPGAGLERSDLPPRRGRGRRGRCGGGVQVVGDGRFHAAARRRGEQGRGAGRGAKA